MSKDAWKDRLASSSKWLAFGALAASCYFLHQWYTERAASKTQATAGSKESEKDETPTLQWLHDMPKIELHAHLHGSIPPKLLASLYSELSQSQLFKDVIKDGEDPIAKVKEILKETTTFQDCFAIFDVVHRVVQSKDVLERISEAVFLSFAQENVKYLEIRSTPRALKHSNNSREDYVRILLECIESFPKQHAAHKDMTIKLILTIDNAKPYEEAVETVELIRTIWQEYSQSNKTCPLVGLDFAPKPFEDKHMNLYLPLLLKARDQYHIPITIHFAEYYHQQQQRQVLQFRPQRLGHAINMDDENFETMFKDPIPIEMCPTSNMMTKSISKYHDHVFKRLITYSEGLYPMIICTDDKGVFHSELHEEWFRMVNAFPKHLTKRVCKQLTINATMFSFLPSVEKNLSSNCNLKPFLLSLKKNFQNEF
ncbi:hypothetical protein RFI_16403 [Reticulomyxa filosa]|uniref:Adenosine deaminase domain-containing protein n=1 Tax=Reticulomyxa filosa TaxID=46433 RepID=X6N3F7_RETFI|nr:hypothetical protein RFI_16403 [Reticulomyxa filosa]|eukprot:ETO20815.1 hypothetical protein RFI_16403 [Reticulomyxa filosa]